MSDLVETVADMVVLCFLFATEVTAVSDMVEARVDGLTADTGLANEVWWEAGKEEFALEGKDVYSRVKAVGSG